MAISYDSSATYSSISATSGVTTHIVANQPNRIMWAGFRTNDISLPSAITGVSIGANNFTLWGTLQNDSNNIYDLWYLKNPSTGTQTVIALLGSAQEIRMATTTYYGVDQTSTFGASTSGTVGAADGISQSITTTIPNSLIFSNCSNQATASYVSGTSATERVSIYSIGGGVVQADKQTSSTGTNTIGFSGTALSSSWGQWNIEMNPASTFTSKNTQAVCFW